MPSEEQLIPLHVNRSRYYNIVVANCPRYVWNDALASFVRSEPIRRHKYNKKEAAKMKIMWPPHPRNARGYVLGAVAILQCPDTQRILLVRNSSLWGLPKGGRNFKEHTVMRSEFVEAFNNNHPLPHFQLSHPWMEEETALENVQREVREETGIDLTKEHVEECNEGNNHSYTRFYCKLSFPCRQYREVVERATHQGLIDHENDEIKWFSIQELQQMVINHYSNRQLNFISFSFLRSRIPMC